MINFGAASKFMANCLLFRFFFAFQGDEVFKNMKLAASLSKASTIFDDTVIFFLKKFLIKKLGDFLDFSPKKK